MISYDGNLDVGLNIDAAAVEHPARLAELLGTSFKDLHRAKAKAKTTATGPATAKD
jgi:hypothetical protein